MSPQTQEEGTLAFARNMKVDTDGNIVSDYGYNNISSLSSYNIVGHIVGLNNKIYFFASDKIEGTWQNSKIIEYDEFDNKLPIELNTVWNYAGGIIDGYVSTNISGEKILTIGEYFEEGSKVPLKHINLSHLSAESDESLYSQAPKIPLANVTLKGTYVKTIPNGVYVFFVRYKIRKDVYTNWFLCSRPIFSGTSESISTLQGGLKYINYHKDSAKSFILNCNFVFSEYKSLYKEFQLGFIITHDEATEARIWKSFDMPTDNTSLDIYFDYDDISETNIDNLLETTYELYNVGNITSFKNKLYISNYKESNFNPDLTSLANSISLSVVHSNASASDIRNMRYKRVPLTYNYEKGYYEGIRGRVRRGDLDYSISKLAKGSQRENTSVASFKVKWLASENPDVASIYSVENKLIGNAIFGSDTITPYAFLNGLRQIDVHGNLWTYEPSDTPHPWHTKGLTFAYGSCMEQDVAGNHYCQAGTYRFNVFTRHSYNGDHPDIIGWTTRDKGFNDLARASIDSNIKDEIKGLSYFAKCYIEISSGANTYRIGYNTNMDKSNYAGGYSRYVNPGGTLDFVLQYSESFDSSVEKVAYTRYTAKSITDLITNNEESLNNSNTDSNTYFLNEKIKDWVYLIIQQYIIGLDEIGTPILDLSTVQDYEDISQFYPDNVVASSISVVFKKFEFDVDNSDLQVDDETYTKQYDVNLKTTDYTSVCTFSIKSSNLSITNKGVVDGNDNSVSQSSTLMPLSSYKAYAHFVDKHGIITNGYPINNITSDSDAYITQEEGIIKTSIARTTGDVITLNYSIDNQAVSNKGEYDAFFISLVNIGNLVVEGFNYAKADNGTTNIINCLEIDAMLYNINDNITVKIFNASGNLKETVTDAIYYSSGSAYPPLAFGNCGYISWENLEDYTGCTFYVVINRKTDTEKNITLHKASAYIKIEQQTDVALSDGFYGSYFCLVKKPDFKLSSSCYVAGNDIYAINRNSTLTLNDFKSFVQIQTSITRCIRSNFNLNYLSLTEDITDKIFSVGSASSGVKQVAKVINSSTLSFIYELKSMYKDFANKTFKPYDVDYKVDFDNTIRVSNVLSDETFNNSIFKFKAEDYYNVPTDRGTIVNLFAIGNTIYVHTKAGLYKFDANQSIMANNEDITLQESEPFDIGISQVFDSEFGYGGINNKEAGCITFDSYLFYDQFSNHIFAYGGNGQITLIDASIQKILSIYKPIYCRTLHDDVNRRILFEFTTPSYDTFTISYNYKAKAFISVHDISLENTFASRNFAYSYLGNVCKLFDTTNGISSVILDDNLHILKLFGDATKVSIIQFGTHNSAMPDTCFSAAILMFPRQYVRENVEFVTIDTDVVQNPIEEIEEAVDNNNGYYFDLIKAIQHQPVNPIHKMVIITDCCVSTPITGTINDANRPESLKETPPIPNALTDYKGFKYDAGSWNANYFRNALNTNNIYNYPNQPRRTQIPNSDNSSLVYGKYFIINLNFIVSSPIKLESIFINSNKY